MRDHINITLLNEFKIEFNDIPLKMRRASKRDSLMALLIMDMGKPLERDTIARKLWSETDRKSRLRNLRTKLSDIKTFLATNLISLSSDTILQSDQQHICWYPQIDCKVDVLHLFELLNQTKSASSSLGAKLQLLDLHKGPFLPHIDDGWVRAKRGEIESEVSPIYKHAIDGLRNISKFERAIHYAQQWLRFEPEMEEIYQTLMLLYMNVGQYGKAEEIYALCTDMLQIEKSKPSEELQNIYCQLSNQDTGIRRLNYGSRPVMFGRHSEWQKIQDIWDDVMKSSRSHLIHIYGIAGIGKSNLVEQVQDWEEQQLIPVHFTDSSSSGTFGPITALFNSKSMEKNLLSLSDKERHDISRLLPGLYDTEYTIAGSTVQPEERTRLYNLLVRTIVPNDQPTILILEDIQRFDRESIEWVKHLIGLTCNKKLLIVTTKREGDRDDTGFDGTVFKSVRYEKMTKIQLEGLNFEDSQSLIGHEIGRRGFISDKQMSRIYSRTDGRPLYIVSMIENIKKKYIQGMESFDQLLPSQFKDILGSPDQNIIDMIGRMLGDLSPNARALMEIAAALGNRFSVSDLKIIQATDTNLLSQSLDELEKRELIKDGKNHTYVFDHDYYPEVLYEGLTGNKRRSIHIKIANSLEQSYPEIDGKRALEIAKHYEKGGVSERAIPYYIGAATREQEQGAYSSVLETTKRAQALLDKGSPFVPGETDFRFQILHLQGRSWIGLKGYAAKKALLAFNEALDICGLQVSEERFMILCQLGLIYIVRAELKDAMRVSRQCEHLAKQMGRPECSMEAYLILGITHYYQGEFEQSVEYLKRSIDLYQSAFHSEHKNVYGQDPKVTALGFYGLALWFLGENEDADKYLSKMEEHASLLNHLYSQALASFFWTWYAQLKQDHELMRQYAQDTIEKANEGSFEFWNALGHMFKSWTDLFLDSDANSIKMMRGYTEAYQDIDARVSIPYWTSLRASMHEEIGENEDSLALLSSALKISGETGDCFYDAETLRLMGSLVFKMRGDPVEAMGHYLHSLAITQKQQCKQIEVRTMASIAQLLEREDIDRAELIDIANTKFHEQSGKNLDLNLDMIKSFIV